MVIMKIIVKSPKFVERTFIRIYQRYYKCTTPLVHNNSHPFHHNTPPPHPKKNNNNNSRTGLEQCSQEFVKLQPSLDYLIKSGKNKMFETWKCSDVGIDEVPG